jgi:hypothetical protein
MSMGLRKGPILPIVQTNGRYKSPVKIREVQLSSVRSDDCRRGLVPSQSDYDAHEALPLDMESRNLTPTNATIGTHSVGLDLAPSQPFTSVRIGTLFRTAFSFGPHLHSARSALAGSTLNARFAGSQQATKTRRKAVPGAIFWQPSSMSIGRCRSQWHRLRVARFSGH